MRPTGCAVWATAAALWTAPALAQPSIWDEARDPDTGRAYRALLAAESTLVRASDADPGTPLRRYRLQRALRKLGRHVDGPDVRLTFLRAELWTGLGGPWERQIIDTLRPALVEIEDASLAEDGWYLLGLAAARLGDRELECSAYDRALQLEWRTERRANIYYNRADAKLGLGRLEAAEVDYRRAIRLGRLPETQALAYYGLGMALERRGDLPSALRAIRLAVRVQHPAARVGVLDREEVFFVPEYELYYYKALEAMALAGEPDDPSKRSEHLARAVGNWHLYLIEAEPAGERWVPNAKRHLATCERLLDERGRQQPDERGRR